MKKLLLIATIVFSTSVFSQELYWYDVFFEIPLNQRSQAEEIIIDYYSNQDIPENISVSLSRIPLKGSSMKATHIISISSDNSKSLADYRSSLTGTEWSLYVAKLINHVSDVYASTGKGILNYNLNVDNHPVGQAWIFKVKDVDRFSEAFGQLMQTLKLDGFVSMGQIVHGADNGENIYVYSTSKDLKDAMDFGPKSNMEKAAFEKFFKETTKEEFTRTWTRVLVEKFN